MRRVVLVPGVLALLPEYAGLADPVGELRAACREAVSWLLEDPGPVLVLADDQGARVARHLLADASHAGHAGHPVPPVAPDGACDRVLVVANGSARRSEKAPGHLDTRADRFDEALGAALRAPALASLTSLDLDLADELLAGNGAGMRDLGARLQGGGPAVVDYDDDPYGVQYWVMRWTCES